VYLAFGTAGANLRWENPSQVTSSATGCIGWIAGSLTAAIVTGVFTGIPFVFSLFDLPELLAQLIGLAAGLALCAGVMTAALLWARRRVAWIAET
jgi:hypothetical protein